MNKFMEKTELRLSHSFKDDEGKIRCRACKTLLQSSSQGIYHACKNGCHKNIELFEVSESQYERTGESRRLITIGSKYYKLVNNKLKEVIFFNDVLFTQKRSD